MLFKNKVCIGHRYHKRLLLRQKKVDGLSIVKKKDKKFIIYRQNSPNKEFRNFNEIERIEKTTTLKKSKR